ncbi:MAG: hypothetical protein NT062_30245, partial [Proteobacteria bacterium]|nr:hypothetical protein [Pseudomonadota bacterium]
DGAEPEHCAYALAFVEHGGRTLLVHAPAWNRLEAIDARTGEPRTARGPTTAGPDDATPPLHDLDYFHGGLEASPDDRWIVDNGWVWHPVGIVTVFSVDAWLGGNVWETEDGPTRRALAQRLYHWDKPVCWLDDHHLAIAGYGDDDAWLLPDAVRIFDVRTGVEQDWFPGPHGELVADRLLFALGEAGLTAWDPIDGARLAHAPDARAHRYHPDAKVFTSLPSDGRATLTRLVGLDAALAHGVVRDLATTIARDRSFHELPVLGDALEASGCTDAAMLAHCHAGGDHGDRCWVLDRLLAS